MSGPQYRRTCEAGFTLVELLIALVLGLGLSLIVIASLSEQVSAWRVHPAAADLTERARAAIDLVAADLTMAGAGIEQGPAAGPLSCCLPAVLPRRLGRSAADAPTTARDDRITVVWSAAGRLAGALATPLTATPALLDLDPTGPCGVRPACGWPDGSTLVVFDEREHHDYYVLAAPVGGSPVVSIRQRSPGFAYRAGAVVSPVQTHTYYYDAAQRQLRHYDGVASDVPAVDHVAGVTFAYVAEAAPPTYPKPLATEANCLYDAAGNRWPSIGWLSGAVGNLVQLPVTALADGPWCGAGDNRFDVDLLRVRRVRMTIRLQAPDDLRDTGSLFAAPGSSRSSRRLLPDVQLTLDIAPRNLNAGR